MPAGILRPDDERAELKERMVAYMVDTTFSTFTGAAASVGVSRSEMYNWLDDDAVFKSSMQIAREKARESTVDFAEQKLQELIDDKNPQAIMFLLKCLGKSRGYIENVAGGRGGGETPASSSVTINQQNNTTNNTVILDAITDDQRLAGLAAIFDTARKRRSKQIDGGTVEMDAITGTTDTGA